MNFCRAGTLLSSLQMAESSAVTRRSSISLNTTPSGFVFSADLMVNETPIPLAVTRHGRLALITQGRWCSNFADSRQPTGRQARMATVVEVSSLQTPGGLVPATLSK